MSIFVVIDDWGYDGATNLGVCSTLEAAQLTATEDSDNKSGRQLTNWEPSQPFKAVRQWTCKCGGHDYVIQEFELSDGLTIQ
jgi:hypothetical protein